VILVDFDFVIEVIRARDRVAGMTPTESVADEV